nr:hypothetical protein KPHV_15090 [Kitasatospora purpeofusca]
MAGRFTGQVTGPARWIPGRVGAVNRRDPAGRRPECGVVRGRHGPGRRTPVTGGAPGAARGEPR